MSNQDNNLNLASFQPVTIEFLLRINPGDAEHIQAIYRAAWQQVRREHNAAYVNRLSPSSYN